MHAARKSWARASSGINLSRSAKALAHNSAVRVDAQCLGAAASHPPLLPVFVDGGHNARGAGEKSLHLKSLLRSGVTRGWLGRHVASWAPAARDLYVSSFIRRCMVRGPMNAKTRLLAAWLSVALLGGCGQFFSWNVSGIPDALEENPILTAGAPFGSSCRLAE